MVIALCFAVLLNQKVRGIALFRSNVFAAVRRIAGSHHFAVALVMHEDYDAQGIYLYEVQRGTQRMEGYVLRENVPMRELAESFGFIRAANPGDPDTLHYVMELA